MTQFDGTIFRIGIGPPVEAATQGTLYFDSAAGFQTYLRSGPPTTGTWNKISALPIGGGAVFGPGVTVDNDIVIWDGVTGTLVKDTGVSISADGTFAANSDLLVPTQKAAKTYTDAVAQGLDVRASCLLATAAPLAANTYANGALGVGATLTANANGALTIDGVAVVATNRVLVKNEVTTANNGIYTVTAAGSGGTPYVLTRATDYDQAADILAGTFTFVESGTVNAGGGFVMTTTGAIVVGTTAIVWTQFSGAGEITVTTPLTKAGNSLGIVNQGTTTQVLHGNAGGNASFGPVVLADMSTLPALVLIASSTTTGANKITFATISTLIPAGFTPKGLEVRVSTKSSTAATFGIAVQAQFNGDTGANYDFVQSQQVGTAAATQNSAVAQTSISFGFAADSGANTVGWGTLEIFNYLDTNAHKLTKNAGGLINGTAVGNTIAQSGAGRWRNTGAVDQIDILISSGNFSAPTLVELFARA